MTMGQKEPSNGALMVSGQPSEQFRSKAFYTSMGTYASCGILWPFLEFVGDEELKERSECWYLFSIAISVVLFAADEHWWHVSCGINFPIIALSNVSAIKNACV
eukprot:scaffold443532_cov37-Prasinocladus_malaysianus.AAC.1